MPKNITVRMCETKVTKQTKYLDKACPGFYVQITPTCPATFYLRFTCPILKQRRYYRIGLYHPELLSIEMARIDAMALKVRISRGEDIMQSRRQATSQQAKLSGVTMGQVIDERIAYVSEEIEVRTQTEDGVVIKVKPRKKDHVNMASHLNRFVRPRLGKMVASEVSNDDIAQLQEDILAGKLIIKGGRTSKKGSVSSARHMRKAVSGLFKWAAQPPRRYVHSSPCVDLPELPKEPPRKRKLTPDEIRVLWHGLDRADLPAERKVCLALKFTLLTMLRSIEALHIHRREFDKHGGLNSKLPLVIIPEERVKAGREIWQPLSDLAVEIAKEALGNYPYLFTGRFGTEPVDRKAMAAALRGRKEKVKGKMTVKAVGLCELLGLRPFTPHDLRRTAASLLGSLKVPRSTISLCLDHTIKSDDQGEVAAVTSVYDQDPRIGEKREALQKLADEIRRIVGEPAAVNHTDAARRAA
jgi:integrase